LQQEIVVQIDVHEHGGMWYISTGWKDAADYPLKVAKGSKDESRRRGRFGYRFHWSVEAGEWIERLYKGATAFNTREAARTYLSDHRATLTAVDPVSSSGFDFKTIKP
jgi:hypothetical protein